MKRGYRIIYGLGMVALLTAFIGCGGGGESAPATVPTVSFTLNWGAPTTDADGNALSGLSGYNVYYGPQARTGSDPKVCNLCGYTQRINVSNVTSHTLNLPKGTYYFSITAYDASGNESVFSNEANATK